jgi:hypothetical protein
LQSGARNPRALFYGLFGLLLTHVAPRNFGTLPGQAELMFRLAFDSSIYVQIFRGRLALIIKNLKAYFLALPKIGEAGLPDRREMNKNVCAAGVRFYESVAF